MKTLKTILAVLLATALMVGLSALMIEAYDVDAVPANEVADVAVPSENGVEREPVFRLTYEGQKMLARLVWLEVRGQSTECQRMICEVILNRLASGLWGNTITDVMFAEGQFPPVRWLYQVTDETEGYAEVLDIVQTVCMEGCKLLPARTIFYCEYPFSWAVYEGYCDGCYFASSVYYQVPDGMTWEEWNAE